MQKKYPKVSLVGLTVLDFHKVECFLADSQQTAFLDDIDQAQDDGISPQGILTSMMGKLCYRSLDPSKNKNLTGSRAIAENIQGLLASAHGSVMEHVYFNFVFWDVSRVFTHELVRHRVFTVNVRTLRHLFMLRTSPFAEWEIRAAFCKAWMLVQEVCPELFADATVTPDNDDTGLFTVSGMKTQPYEA